MPKHTKLQYTKTFLFFEDRVGNILYMVKKKIKHQWLTSLNSAKQGK